MTRLLFGTVLGILSISLSPLPLQANEPQALPSGEALADSRLNPLRTLDSEFPFHQVDDADAWAERATDLSRQMLVANGLWPMPSATPLRATVWGKVERDDYTVERVHFESFPGHFVTGSLYRPKNLPSDAKAPGVLSPHGHWSNGRFYDHGEAGIESELASGAERFEVSGRYPLQARCVHLARMGCVVFHYDMVGYADSQQIEHRPGVREGLSNHDSWVFFSPQAEHRLQNMMGLQTYNSIRALDFLLSLSDVDSERIGVTGASGGGTQTMILGAVDDRPTALFPAVMVSTAMQGGCSCENAPYLRIDAGNIDIAALAAPRPLGMTAADDWTKEIASKGQPDLESLYSLLGLEGKLQVSPFLEFGHNFNAVSREAMYGFMNTHLHLHRDDLLTEQDFVPLTVEEMTVWSGEAPHQAPTLTGPDHERALLSWWSHDSDAQIAALEARLGEDDQPYRETVGGAWKTILARSLKDITSIDFTLVEKEEIDAGLLMTGLITNNSFNEQLPALFVHPGEAWNGEVILSLHDEGKSAALLTESGDLRDSVKEMAAAGYSIMSIDWIGVGEFAIDAHAGRARLNNSDTTQPWQKYAAYTFGYNHPIFVQRVHDILTAVAFVKDNPQWEAQQLHLIGTDGAGAEVAAARFAMGDAFPEGRTVIDTEGFRFGDILDFGSFDFVPGAVKYGDLPSLIALSAPAPIMLLGENEISTFVPRTAYLRANSLTLAVDVETAVNWLMDSR